MSRNSDDIRALWVGGFYWAIDCNLGNLSDGRLHNLFFLFGRFLNNSGVNTVKDTYQKLQTTKYQDDTFHSIFVLLNSTLFFIFYHL